MSTLKPTTVADIMTTQVITVSPEARLTEAIKIILRHSISALPVVDLQQNLLGIVTDYDIMNLAFSGHAAETTVQEVMTREVMTFTPETSIEKLVNYCAEKRFHRVPIVKDQKIVGIVSRRDILRFMDHLYSEY